MINLLAPIIKGKIGGGFYHSLEHGDLFPLVIGPSTLFIVQVGYEGQLLLSIIIPNDDAILNMQEILGIENHFGAKGLEC